MKALYVNVSIYLQYIKEICVSYNIYNGLTNLAETWWRASLELEDGYRILLSKTFPKILREQEKKRLRV